MVKVETEIESALQDLSKTGFERKLFETVLHQMEFQAKKTKEHIGLGYLSHLVPFCLHGGDPLSFFKIDEFSKRIRKEYNQGGLFEGLIKKHFINNNHKLRLELVPDETVAEKDEKAEQRRLRTLSKILTKEEKESIVQEAYSLQKHQEKLQDQAILPSLTLDDISRNIEFVDSKTTYIGDKVKCHWYDQPTNGISYIRIKADLKSLPEKHRIFVPMFKDLLANIGTKNYKYDVFNDKVMSCTNGLEVSIDKYAYSEDHTDIHNRNE